MRNFLSKLLLVFLGLTTISMLGIALMPEVERNTPELLAAIVTEYSAYAQTPPEECEPYETEDEDPSQDNPSPTPSSTPAPSPTGSPEPNTPEPEEEEDTLIHCDADGNIGWSCEKWHCFYNVLTDETECAGDGNFGDDDTNFEFKCTNFHDPDECAAEIDGQWGDITYGCDFDLHGNCEVSGQTDSCSFSCNFENGDFSGANCSFDNGSVSGELDFDNGEWSADFSGECELPGPVKCRLDATFDDDFDNCDLELGCEVGKPDCNATVTVDENGNITFKCLFDKKF